MIYNINVEYEDIKIDNDTFIWELYICYMIYIYNYDDVRTEIRK